MSAAPGSHVARALALAAFRPGGAGDAALAQVGGRDGIAARALLVALTAPGGAALGERLRAELAAARPAGWRAVHASWLDAALDGELAAVRAAVTGDGGAPHERFLARAYLGDLVPMPDPVAPGSAAVALVALDPALLARALSLLGRRLLAHALGAGSPRVVAELAARLPWGKELVVDLAALSALGDAAEARLGRRKSALARTAGLSWSEPLALPRAGLRAIAPVVDRVPDLARQLAQRLPRPAGVVALAELRAFVEPADGAGEAEIARAIARATVAPP